MLEVLRALFGSNRRPSLVAQANNQFLEMLDMGENLLEKAQPHLLDKDAKIELLKEARDIDKSTNRLVRAIRKMLIAHLSFNKHDASTCLILMSVVKDAERLVDECRSLLNLATLVEDPVPEEYRTALSESCTAITEVLKATRTAFAENDEASALALVESEKPFIESMKPDRDKILDDTRLSPRQAVVTARAFHIMQRIRAHLGNIASTVVFPVHQIDFAKQKFVDAAKQRLNK